MNFAQFKYFIAVYEEKNITLAARRCFISQPSISNAIKELEEELATKLFIRHKRGVSITQEAHHLYPIVIKVINDIAKIPELFNMRKKTCKLTIAIFPYLSPGKIADTIRHVYQSVDQLKLSLVNIITPYDAIITLDVLKKEDEIFLPLWEEDYMLCAAKNHPILQYKNVLPQDLHNFDFIECPSCEAHQQTIGLLACNGFKINIIAEAEDKSQVMHLVQSGIGVSFLPSGVLEASHDLAIIPFKGPRMFRRIGFCYPANKTLSPVLSDAIIALSKLSCRF